MLALAPETWSVWDTNKLFLFAWICPAAFKKLQASPKSLLVQQSKRLSQKTQPKRNETSARAATPRPVLAM